VKWKRIALCVMAHEKSEYEWMNSENMHAHFIENTNKKVQL
jgi:hypothetical protein